MRTTLTMSIMSPMQANLGSGKPAVIFQAL